eukprot:1754904-Prymnesium_polylepis.1
MARAGSKLDQSRRATSAVLCSAVNRNVGVRMYLMWSMDDGRCAMPSQFVNLRLPEAEHAGKRGAPSGQAGTCPLVGG